MDSTPGPTGTDPDGRDSAPAWFLVVLVLGFVLVLTWAAMTFWRAG
jgi:hypothetical protein